MRIPVIEVTGPTWAKMALGMSCVPYSYGFWPHSGRYVPVDFGSGEYSNPVQLSEAIEVCYDMVVYDGCFRRDVVVIHVLPSMHDFFSEPYWDFYWFNTRVNDSRRERRNKIAYETHVKKMREYKNSCLWCITLNEYLLIGDPPCQDGPICPKHLNYRDRTYDEDIPF